MSNEPGERRRRRDLERERAAVAQQATAGQSAQLAETASKAPVSRRARRDRERAVAETTAERAAASAASAPQDPIQRTFSKDAAGSGRPEEDTVSRDVHEAPTSAPLSRTRSRSDHSRSDQSRPAEPRPAASHPAASHPAEPRPAASHPAESHPAESRTAELKPAEPRPAQAWPSFGAPSSPADTQRAASPSRRSIRGAASPVDSAQAPIVILPATTGMIRATAPAADQTSVRRTRVDGSAASRAHLPVVPRRSTSVASSAPAVAPSEAPMEQVPHAGAYWQDPHPPTAPTSIPAAAFAPIFGERGAPSPGVAAPVSQAWSEVVDAPAPSPADSAEDDSSDDGGSPLTPRWGDVALTSFDAITRPDSDAVPAVTRQRSQSREADAPEPDGPSYTWLHMLALVLVAFVFGCLVWLLINKASPSAGAAGGFAPVPATSTSGTSSPHQGEL